jgi:hypothetical protein
MDEKNERELKEKGLKITFHPDRLDVMLNVSINREKATLFVFLLVTILLVLASALNAETRKLLLEALLGTLQLLVTLPEKNQ